MVDGRRYTTVADTHWNVDHSNESNLQYADTLVGVEKDYDDRKRRGRKKGIDFTSSSLLPPP
jgi:hypothetical protein